jgi:hypothetical protein
MPLYQAGGRAGWCRIGTKVVREEREREREKEKERDYDSQPSFE